MFGWKKKILELRLQLERELENQIADRADRRERWRSSSPFSAEVKSISETKTSLWQMNLFFVGSYNSLLPFRLNQYHMY